MLIDVRTFCHRVESDLNGLIDELQTLTGRYTESETLAWQNSLPKLSVLLAKPQLEDFHLYLDESGALSLEYRLPASSSWCDVVLLGRDLEKPSVLILEMKDWDTKGDLPGPLEGLITHHGSYRSHPSDQVKGYVNYCTRFHSVVQDEGADVRGCVYFTRDTDISSYLASPHDALTRQYPVFVYTPRDIDRKFPDFVSAFLRRPDFDFAQRFEKGSYKQDRDFCQQMARQIRHPEESPFELLDEQRLGFDIAMAKIRAVFSETVDSDRKAVVIIEGPPGSGKSVIAARLWAELVSSPDMPTGNVVLTTTSASQRSNWEGLFEKVGKGKGGRGFVMPANRYAPATTNWVGTYRREHPEVGLHAGGWKENFELCKEDLGDLRCKDDTFLVSIVDEAHALMNPEKPKARPGTHGWPVALGPQAWHIIRCSRVSIFLMDSDQSFRDVETTTKEDILKWAGSFGASTSAPVDLGARQFRCGGSKDYMDWLEGCLGIHDLPLKQPVWRKTKHSPAGKMVLEIVEDPLALEENLRPLLAEGNTARLVAAYGRPWITKKVENPHDLPAPKMDFNIEFTRGREDYKWSKIWNYAPNQNYTYFIQAPKPTRMHDDPLCEVGCPYTVRGFDYSYLGVLWLSDLVRRGDRWVFDLDHIHESALRQTIGQAKKEDGEGSASAELLRRLQQVYRILLSRAIRGIYVWFEDEETREYIESILPR